MRGYLFCFQEKKRIHTRGVIDLSSIHYPKFKQSHLQRCFHRDNNITFEQGTGCFEFCNDFHSSNQIGFMIIILLRWLATYIYRPSTIYHESKCKQNIHATFHTKII